MDLLTPPRRFESERMDEPGVPHEMLVGNLRDIARFNHLFGGVRAVLHHLERLVRGADAGRTGQRAGSRHRFGRHPARSLAGRANGT